MLSKKRDAVILAISEDKAQSLGIYQKGIEHVLINGKNVDVNLINENSLRWNLPNIIVKANAYLSAIARNKGEEKFVNVFSNKEKNFSRWSERNLTHEWASLKTNVALETYNYGYQEMSDQIILHKPFKNHIIWNDDEVAKYIQEIQENETLMQRNNLLNKQFDNLDLKTEIISNFQVLLILLHDAFLNLQGQPEQKQYLQKVKEMIARIKRDLEALGYSFLPTVKNIEKETVESVPETFVEQKNEPQIQPVMQSKPVEPEVSVPKFVELSPLDNLNDHWNGQDWQTKLDVVPVIPFAKKQDQFQEFAFGKINATDFPEALAFDPRMLEEIQIQRLEIALLNLKNNLSIYANDYLVEWLLKQEAFLAKLKKGEQ